MNGATYYKIRYKPNGEFYTFNLKGNVHDKRLSRLNRIGTTVPSLITAKEIIKKHIKWNSDWKLEDFEIVQFTMKEVKTYDAI